MKTQTWKPLAVALASATLALALGGTAMAAQAAVHSHDEAAPHKLSLDQGRKWATDDALRKGMDRIRALVAPRVADAHAGRMDAAKYAALGSQVEVEVGRIVAECKLEPRADAMLHVVIAGMVEGADGMAGKNASFAKDKGLVRVATAVNDYGKHFEHPGFKPIPLGH